MKNLRGLAYIIGVSLLGVGVATIVTNPDQAGYERYAAQRLTVYLQENACAKAGILEDTCESALRDNQDQLRQFISTNTERHNYGLWSIYETNLSPDDILPSAVSGLLPSYHFETVGVFSSFYTYKADRI